MFPKLQYRSYLNHAAISPPSTLSKTAVLDVLDDVSAFGAASFPNWMEQREGLRQRISGLIGSHAEEIGLVANTTTGILQAAWSIDWRKGDRIVLYGGEFPTNITPWQQVASEYQLDISWIDARHAYLDVERILQETEDILRKGVRLLSISAVQFQTGLALPLQQIGELCKKHGALFFVDGIQAVGVVPLNVRDCHIDMMSCGSHKWLMGVEGCGFIFINSHIQSQLKPRLTGWLSHQDGLRFLFEGKGHLRYDLPLKQDASFVEGGAYNSIGFAVLDRSIALLMEIGVEEIYQHINLFHDRFEKALEQLGFQSLRHSKYRSGILSMLPPPTLDGAVLVEKLDRSGISCSFPDGNIRLSPHWPNDLAEVPMVIAAIEKIIDEITTV